MSTRRRPMLMPRKQVRTSCGMPCAVDLRRRTALRKLSSSCMSVADLGSSLAGVRSDVCFRRRIQPVNATRYSAKAEGVWMRRRPRTMYTETQKALMWERWKKGETLHQIARLFDRPQTSIRQILAESGGIRPPERRRSKLALTLAEREEISRALVAGESIRAVAARLARAPSTISREITRNGGASCYRAAQADQVASTG